MATTIHDDLFAPDVIADPYGYFGRLREEDPARLAELYRSKERMVHIGNPGSEGPRMENRSQLVTLRALNIASAPPAAGAERRRLTATQPDSPVHHGGAP